MLSIRARRWAHVETGRGAGPSRGRAALDGGGHPRGGGGGAGRCSPGGGWPGQSALPGAWRAWVPRRQGRRGRPDCRGATGGERHRLAEASGSLSSVVEHVAVRVGSSDGRPQKVRAEVAAVPVGGAAARGPLGASDRSRPRVGAAMRGGDRQYLRGKGPV